MPFLKLFMFAVLTSLAPSFAQANELAPLPKHLHTTLLCESMLWTKSQVKSEGNLGELFSFMVNFNDVPAKMPKRRLPLKSFTFTTDDPMKLKGAELEALNHARIRAIETLTKNDPGNGTYSQHVVASFRGQEQVERAYAEFRVELDRSTENVKQLSLENFDKQPGSALKAVAARVGFIGGTLGGMTALQVIDPTTAIGASAVYMGISYVGDVAINFLWPALMTSNFKTHLEAIESSLASPGKPIYSAALTKHAMVPTRVHRAFMRLGEEDLPPEVINDLLEHESYLYQPSYKKSISKVRRLQEMKGLSKKEQKDRVLEKMKQDRIAEPMGVQRLLTLDSYYYWDQKTNEPVWILFYEAKNPTQARGKPKKAKPVADTQKETDFGLNPGFAN